MFNKILCLVSFFILSISNTFAESIQFTNTKITKTRMPENRFGLIINKNSKYPLVIEYALCKYNKLCGNRDGSFPVKIASIAPNSELKIPLTGYLNDKDVEFIVIEKASMQNEQKSVIAETHYELSDQGCISLSFNSRNGNSRRHDSIVVLDRVVNESRQIICNHIDNSAQMVE